MSGLLLKKFSKAIWFIGVFVIIMLFYSLPLKNFVENYVTVFFAFITSLIIIPIYVFFKRCKNQSFKALFLKTEYSDEDSPISVFRKSPLFVHYKAEIIITLFFTVIGVLGLCYYFAKDKHMPVVIISATVMIISAFVAVAVIDFCVWMNACSYWAKTRKK